MTNYYRKLDKFLAPQEENRFLSGKQTGSEGGQHLHKPITPISKLGTTFTDNARGNIVNSMLASIRQGTGKLQLAVDTALESQVGRPFTSWGKSTREAVKEVIKTSGVDFVGLELPTKSQTNMSGWDMQRSFSEQKRQTHIKNVKEAIDFVAEIGTGGGVQVWSQEYFRNIQDGKFQNKGGPQFQEFEGFDENKDAVKTLVDTRNGQLIMFQTGSLGGQNSPNISVPVWRTAHANGVGPNGVAYEQGDYLDDEGNKIVPNGDRKKFIMNRVPEWDKEKGQFKTQALNWSQFKDYANERNKHEGMDLSAEEWWYRTQLENQYAQIRSQAMQTSSQVNRMVDELGRLKKSRDFYAKLEDGKSEEELMQSNLLVQANQPLTPGGAQLPPEYKKRTEVLKESIDELQYRLRAIQDQASQYDAQAENIWDGMTSIKQVDEFAQEKTSDSYAEAAIYAYEQTKRHDVKRNIHVGPELGWPTNYGGHADEFIEIVNNSRKTMVDKMRKDSRYAQYSTKELQGIAKQSISGTVDTSHLSMWYNHFPKKDKHETEESRLKRFNKWYTEQIEKIGKAGVAGEVQVVDSYTGDHAHMAVGEGVFPTVEAAKILQKYNPDIEIVSEGHESEQSAPGTIQYSLWNAFGANMGSQAHFAVSGGNAFGNIYRGQGGAAGYRAPPNYIVGAYVPSNEWQLWSGVNLE